MAPIALLNEALSCCKGLVQLLEEKHGYKCRMVKKCAADIVLCHQPGYTSKAVAFHILDPIDDATSAAFYENLYQRLKQSNRSFPKTYLLIRAELKKGGEFVTLLPDLQAALMRHAPQVPFYLVSRNDHSMLALMLHLRQQHVMEKEKSLEDAIDQIQHQLFTPDMALSVAQKNFDFLTEDECIVLLDLYGMYSSVDAIWMIYSWMK